MNSYGHLSRIAAILDEFSFSVFACDAEIVNLTLNNWRNQLVTFSPQILLVESAWFGYQKQWHRKISVYSIELDEIISWFKERNIPTVFWCKEDPIHFDRFLETASYFDFVFTTDIESIPRYKAALGHSRIYLLPFACQPKFHNPIETFARNSKSVYAGSFYRRYIDRTKDAVKLFELSKRVSGLDIYDRYFNSDDPNYFFPEVYRENIKGYLSLENIDVAYKGYRYGINLNTVQNSRSMFSRRAIELLGSGTIVVGNYSRGLNFLFGEITLGSDLELDLESRFRRIENDHLMRAKLSLNGIRKVMLEHTCAHRLNTISNIVFSDSKSLVLPEILVLVDVRKSSVLELENLILNLINQAHVNWKAIVVGNLDFVVLASLNIAGDPRFIILNSLSNLVEKIEKVINLPRWVALMTSCDYYGPNYLLDLVLGTQYSSAKAFGKGSFYELANEQLVFNNDSPSFAAINSLNLRSSLVSADIFSTILASINTDSVDFNDLEVSDGVSLDCFGYCKNAYAYSGMSLERIQEVVDDRINSPGSTLEDLYAISEGLNNQSKALGFLVFRPSKLESYFGNRFNSQVSGVVDRFGWHIISELPDMDTCDLFSEYSIPIEDLGGKFGTPFYMEAGVGLQMQLLVRFEEASGAFIDEAIFEVNTQNLLTPPDLSTHIRLGYRVTSSGSSRITRLVLA